MPHLLTRIPPDAVAPPAEPGDLIGLAGVERRHAGDQVVAVLPGGRSAVGVLLLLSRAWWLLADTQELIALGPDAELFRVLLFRPL
jgi:hypothetical protein